jgi:hypothetical protein
MDEDMELVRVLDIDDWEDLDWNDREGMSGRPGEFLFCSISNGNGNGSGYGRGDGYGSNY